jgi:hypothetical protein
VRALILLALFAALLVACVLWVFPFIDQFVAPSDVTVSLQSVDT